jgi:hypothetical protein
MSCGTVVFLTFLLSVSNMPLNELLDYLANQKAQFIANQSSKVCISIVEKNAYGMNRDRTHCTGLDTYVVIMTCFCRKNYHGRMMDRTFRASRRLCM